jgi:hypothetical protein
MEDYIPVYPSMDDPNIQRIITSKKEFNDLVPLDDEKIDTKRTLLRHQNLFVRLMAMSDRIVNIHEPGTGKTCAFIGAAEHFKGVGSFQRTIIVELSKTLINEVNGQILNKCTPVGEYSADASLETGEISEKARRRRANQSLSSWYIPETYKAFASKLEGMDDDQIAAKYQRHIIIFDEIHNILKPDATKMYQQYMRLCHLAPKIKICAITATPMTNGIEEAFNLFNLLLPMDRQIPLNIEPRLSALEPYFRGKISFIKAKLSNARVNYMGTPFIFENNVKVLGLFDPAEDHYEKIKTRVPMYLSKMGDLQLSQYEMIDSTADYFNSTSKNVGVSVFPIIRGHVTTSADYIEEIGAKLKWKNYPGFISWEERGQYIFFHEWIQNGGDLSNLGRISGKLRDIIDIELKSPGCSFIYDSVVENPGVKFITLIFSLFGYEQFVDSNIDAIFTNQSRTKIKESFQKKRRVALITSRAFGTDARQEAILSLFNHPENVNGEYIKVLVGSPKTRDGINVYHCRRMHLLFPDWHFAGMIQAINRVLRVTGHNDLKKYLINKALNDGLIIDSPEFKKATEIVVDIYRHCIDYEIDRGPDKTKNVDVQTMRIAIQKEISIKQVMFMMKVCALDNNINRSRNIENNDAGFLTKYHSMKDFAPSWTELTVPGYVPFETDPIDYSTYNCLYIDPEKTLLALEKILLEHGSVSYQEIDTLFPLSTKEDIEEVIFRFQARGQYITTPLGEKLSIEMGENGLYLQRFSNTGHPTMVHNISIYDFPQLTVTTRKMSDYFLKKSGDMIEYDILSLFQNNQGMGHSSVEPVSNLSRWKQIKILEELVMGLFHRSIILETKPAKSIQELIDIYKGYLFIFDQEDPHKTAYVHVMVIRSEREKSHNIPTKHRDPHRLRIFRPAETLGWRFPLPEEYEDYRKMIKEQIDSEIAGYEKFQLYGTILQDGSFRVVDQAEEAAINSSTGDRRMNRRGKELKSIKKKDRIKIAVKEKLYPPTEKGSKTKNAKESIEYKRESIKAEQPESYVKSLSDEEVNIYYLWDSFVNMSDVFQETLIEKLRKEGRVYEPYILIQDEK